MARIVVVGAGGFIGRALAARLAREGAPALAVTRRQTGIAAALPSVTLGDLTSSTDWTRVLAGAACVVHLASRTPPPEDRDTLWIEAEAAAAAHVAAAAARAGLRQLVLVSSAKALGEATEGTPFRAVQPLAPGGPYGVAKVRM
jgi:UDP-glucose 4-epimerase